MSHLPVVPIVLPALTAALLIVLHSTSLRVARAVNAISTSAFAAAAVVLLVEASGGEPLVYALGDWPAPFGIVLVVDRLSAFMVVLTSLLAAATLLYAAQGWDASGRFFHPLFQFQLMGLSGAFLTGDLFNLFVFFEVMLIASYCLMLQGLGAQRLRATLHYVALNLTASMVFLVAVSLLYGMTGTLNMAHLAERVARLPEEDVALVRTAGLLLVAVFSVKAALFPLYFWLPAAYSNAAAPVAALFSVMTKVGVYAIVRLTTLVYGLDSAAAGDLTRPWLLPLALTTLVLGALGALGARRLAGMTAYLTVASVGTMLTAVGTGGAAALSAAVYYLAHSTLVVAALFLLADLIGRQRGEMADALRAGPPLRRPALLGLAFLAAGVAVAGTPPSAGFIGKLMVLRSTQGASGAAAIWTIVLATSFLALVACARAGSLVLWKVAAERPRDDAKPPSAGEWIALSLLLASSVLLVVFAAPLKRYTDETAAQLSSPATYIEAVLGPAPGELLRPSTSGPPR